MIDGAITREFEEPLFVGSHFAVAADEGWIDWPGVAKILVRQGRQIVLERYPGADPASLDRLLLTSGLPLLLCQRGLLVLEGACVRKGGDAIALLGKTPCGKSAVSAGLIGRGYSLVSDGLVAIRIDNGVPLAIAGRPGIDLRRDILKLLGKGPDSVRRVRPGVGRFLLPVEDAFAPGEYPLTDALVLSQAESEDEEARLEPKRVEGGQALGWISRCAYRGGFVKSQAASESFFQSILTLAWASEVQRARSPWNCEGFLNWVDRIEEWLGR